MSHTNDSSVVPMLLSLLVGAAAGALLVALNTNKTTDEFRRNAKILARSAKRGVGAVAEDADGLMEDWKERKAHAAGDLKRSMSVSIDDLPG